VQAVAEAGEVSVSSTEVITHPAATCLSFSPSVSLYPQAAQTIQSASHLLGSPDPPTGGSMEICSEPGWGGIYSVTNATYIFTVIIQFMKTSHRISLR